uniref:NTR domain-containing protein n=1 Tax=Parascaris univalens TaxID=6257 RepID=A0A915CCQ8_PARUN
MQQVTRFLVCCLLIVAVDACKCRFLTAQEAFKNAEWVSRVKILRKEEGGVDHIEYEAEHVKIFKNSRSSQLSKEITTPTSTAACGLVSLETGKEYLLSGRFTDRGYLHINSCGQITDDAKNGQPFGFVLEWNEVPNDLKVKLSNGNV